MLNKLRSGNHMKAHPIPSTKTCPILRSDSGMAKPLLLLLLVATVAGALAVVFLRSPDNPGTTAEPNESAPSQAENEVPAQTASGQNSPQPVAQPSGEIPVEYLNFAVAETTEWEGSTNPHKEVASLKRHLNYRFAAEEMTWKTEGERMTIDFHFSDNSVCDFVDRDDEYFLKPSRRKVSLIWQGAPLEFASLLEALEIKTGEVVFHEDGAILGLALGDEETKVQWAAHTLSEAGLTLSQVRPKGGTGPALNVTAVPCGRDESDYNFRSYGLVKGVPETAEDAALLSHFGDMRVEAFQPGVLVCSSTSNKGSGAKKGDLGTKTESVRNRRKHNGYD